MIHEWAVDEMGGQGCKTGTCLPASEIRLQPVDTIAIERPTAEITEADVDAMIESMRKQRPEFTEVDRAAAAEGIGALASSLEPGWSARVDDALARATLTRPAPPSFAWYGKQGRHSEHLGYLLAEMQSLHRAHPGATW